MIYKNEGDQIEYEGKSYCIGQKIIVAEHRLRGLVGVIVEIRTDENTNAKNSSPELYCDLVKPIFKEELKVLSDFYCGLPMDANTVKRLSFKKIRFEPKELEFIEETEPEEESISVYVLEEDWAVRDELGSEVYLFLDENEAKKEMRKRAYMEKISGSTEDWEEDENFVEDASEDSYSAYIEGFYNDNHYDLTITAKSIPLNALPMRLLKKLKK